MAKSKFENLFFALRVLLAVVLLGGLIVGIYLVAYQGYPTVAEWVRPGSHDAFVMDGVTYRSVGELGKGGWKEKDYPIDKSIGRVADDGTATETDPPETLPPDAESGETVKTTPPDGTPDLARDHAYVIYSVKNQENAVILLESTGKKVLYWKESASWTKTDDPSALTCDGDTYRLVGTLGERGLYSKDYFKSLRLGLVRNDLLLADLSEADAETRKRAEHEYIIHSVRGQSHILIVEAPGGKEYLYCRENYPNPPETETEKVTLTETTAATLPNE